MHKDDLLALTAIQQLPWLVDPDGRPVISDLSTWSDFEERMEQRRHRHEAIAHASMSLEELHVFFARAGHSAAQSWNDSQSAWGKIKNLLTTSHVGYAQVPGRIFKQVMDRLDEKTRDEFSPVTTYLLRADVALEFRNRLKTLMEETA